MTERNRTADEVAGAIIAELEESDMTPLAKVEATLVHCLRKLADDIESGVASVLSFTTPNEDKACPTEAEQAKAALADLHDRLRVLDERWIKHLEYTIISPSHGGGMLRHCINELRTLQAKGDQENDRVTPLRTVCVDYYYLESADGG